MTSNDEIKLYIKKYKDHAFLKSILHISPGGKTVELNGRKFRVTDGRKKIVSGGLYSPLGGKMNKTLKKCLITAMSACGVLMLATTFIYAHKAGVERDARTPIYTWQIEHLQNIAKEDPSFVVIIKDAYLTGEMVTTKEYDDICSQFTFKQNKDEAEEARNWLKTLPSGAVPVEEELIKNGY